MFTDDTLRPHSPLPSGSEVSIGSSAHEDINAVSREIEKQLSKVKGDPLRALELFFQFGPSLTSYSGGKTKLLMLTLESVQRTLELYHKLQHDQFMDILDSGPDQVAINRYVGELAGRNKIKALIVKMLISAPGADGRPTRLSATRRFEGWVRLLEEALAMPIKHISRVEELFDPDQTTLLDTISKVRRLFLNHPIKIYFKQMLAQVRPNSLDLSVAVPFEFICAPSGSGKSTFALNMCCDNQMSAYLLFPDMERRFERSQEYNKPFIKVSQMIHDLSAEDYEKLLWKRSSMNKKIRIKDFCKNLMKNKYAIVGLLVSFLRRLHHLKQEYPEKTWLELETMTGKLKHREMTGKEAIQRLQRIKQSYNLPITMFFDEASIETRAETWRMIALRSVCRCLGIVPVFLGTDTRIIDSSRPKANLLSLVTIPKREWAKVFNYVPEYDSAKFEERSSILKARYSRNAPILACLDFLRQVYVKEIPWLVDLAFDYLNDHPFNPEEMRADEYFDLLFSSVLRDFGSRKSYSSHFINGQLRYTMFYSWSKLTVTADAPTLRIDRQHVPESCVNGHFGYLLGDETSRRDETKPCFSLTTTPQGKQYILKPDGREGQRFLPTSVFMSFADAPLSGLVAYGVGPVHRPFLSSEEGLMTCIEAALEAFGTQRAGSSAANNGNVLEILSNAAAIVASRAGGLSGCTFKQFFQHFVAELMTDADTAIQTVVTDLDAWERFKVPFISPMAVGSHWSGATVNFLKAISPNHKPSLGVLYPSLRNELADCVVYFSTLSSSTEKEDDQQQDQQGLPRRGQRSVIDTKPKRVAFVMECKLHARAFGAKRLKKVLHKNFKLALFANSPLFIIVAYKFAKNERLSAAVDTAGYKLWRLTPSEVYARHEFSLKPVSGGTRSVPASRPVILVELRALWGSGHKTIFERISGLRI